MIHSNSREVYESKILPNLKGKHKRVMDTLAELGEATSLDVADKLGVPVHSLSGRFTELSGTSEYDKPLIEEVRKTKNRYGNTCAVWRVKIYQEPLAQVALF